jgi:hypothetical protein
MNPSIRRAPRPPKFAAHHLCRRLVSVDRKHFFEVMGDEVSRHRVPPPHTHALPGPPPQAMLVWEYDDGTVVRYKPLGDELVRAPFFSIGIKTDPTVPHRSLADLAFLIDSRGNPCPKWETHIRNPYLPDRNPLHYKAFRDAVLEASRRVLQ